MGRFSARFAGRQTAGAFSDSGTDSGNAIARNGAWYGRTGVFRRARLFYNPGCAFGALLR